MVIIRWILQHAIITSSAHIVATCIIEAFIIFLITLSFMYFGYRSSFWNYVFQLFFNCNYNFTLISCCACPLGKFTKSHHLIPIFVVSITRLLQNKCILRYLKGTTNQCLLIRHNSSSLLQWMSLSLMFINRELCHRLLSRTLTCLLPE